MTGRGLDDHGLVSSALCPLCDSWCVQVDLDDVPWPLAGQLVEDALDEHFGEHLDAVTDPGRTVQPWQRHFLRSHLFSDWATGPRGLV